MRRSLFLISSCVTLVGCAHASNLDFRLRVDQAPWTFGYAPLAASPFWDPLDAPRGDSWSAQWKSLNGSAFLTTTPVRRGVVTVTGNGTRGPYLLKSPHVLPGSVVVRAGGVIELGSGADYTVDADTGTLSFTRPLPVGRVLTVTYDYSPAPGRWLLGVGAGAPGTVGSGWRAGVTTDLQRMNVSGGYRWFPNGTDRWTFDVHGGFGVQPDPLRSFHAAFTTTSRWTWGDTKVELAVRRPDYRTFFTEGGAEQTRAAGSVRWLLDDARTVHARVVRDERVTTGASEEVTRRLQEYAVDYRFELPEVGAAQVGVFRRLDESISSQAGPQQDHRTGVAAALTGVGVMQGWRFGVDAARRDDASTVYGASAAWLANLDDVWSGEAVVRAEGTVGTTTSDRFLLRVEPNVLYRTSELGVASVGGQLQHTVRGGAQLTKGSVTARYADDDVQATLTRAFPADDSVGGWVATAEVGVRDWRGLWTSTWLGDEQSHSLRVGVLTGGMEPYVLGMYTVDREAALSWETGVRWGALVDGQPAAVGWLGSARLYSVPSVLSGGLEVGYGWSAGERLLVSTNVAASGHFGVKVSGSLNLGLVRVTAVGSGHP